MRSLRLVSIAGVLGSTVLLQTSVFAAPVFAHTHPTPVELDSPAVVFVQTAVKVEISLIEDSPSGGSVQLHQFTYTPVLAQGSGFAVDPSGVVVTDADLTHPDRDKAAIFAVNSAFHDQYGVPLPSDPFAKQSSVTPTSGDRFVNERLQTCYTPNQTDRTGGCVVATTRQVVVFPFVTSQEKYGELPAKVLTPNSDTSGVAVLKIGASSMPTVNLAPSIGDAHAIAVLGFTGVPSTQFPLVEKLAHFTAKGSGVVNSTGEDATKGIFQDLVDALGSGLQGGPAIGETGQVIGLFQQPAQGAQVKMIDASTVREALSKASVTAQRGPTDSAFESAMHRFKNAQFQGSIPGFTQTLKLYPGHFIATQNLATADKKKGTAADKTREGLAGAASSDSGGGTNWLAPTLIALGVLLALAAVVLPLFLRRRRGATGKPRPAGAKPGPAKPRPAAASAKPAGVGPVGPKPASAAPVGPKPASAAPAGPGGHRADGGPARVPTPAGSAPAASGGAGTPLAQRSAAGVSVIQQQGEGQRAGHDVGARTFCTSCGQRLAANNRFCGFCGQPVE